MGNLIQSIPVYRPQTQTAPAAGVNVPAQTAPQAVHKPPFQDIKNQFPQTQTYSYIPARPLADAHNTPIGVRPAPSKARLVHENFFQSIGSTIKSYGDYAKYFYNAAFKGEGKDYNVGKINDLSIRAGSLGIAAVLATSKMFPFAKGMEFVGLGTWFASMAVWPHILGAPIKALYGVNINKEYIDSEGRRKYVYEDNQYRPMDIYRYADLNGKPLSPEEYYKKYDKDYICLDKMGDKLGVPRNIKNRNEATMNRAAQVAVQGKTLWMLTAGVMTPVVSSIVADALQTPLKNQLEKTRYNKASKNLKALESQIDTLKNSGNRDINGIMSALKITVSPKDQAAFNALLTDSGVMTPEQFQKLQDFIDTKFFGSGYKNSLSAAMKRGADMTEPKVFITKELKETIKNITTESVKELLDKIPAETKAKLPEGLLNYQGISEKQINEIIAGVLQTEGIPFDESRTIAFENITKPLGYNSRNGLMQAVTQKTLEPFAFSNLKDKDKKTPQRAPLHNFNRALKDTINAKLKAYFDTKRSFVVDKAEMQKIFNFAFTNNELQKKLKEFEQTSIQNISESMTAINWERVPKKYLKTIGFTEGEMAILATQDATSASKVLSKKFSEIVQDSEKYKKVIKEMADYAKTAISKEEKAVIQLIGTPDSKGVLVKIKELMEEVAQSNFGYETKNELTSHYNLRINEIQRKLKNTIDSYVRPIKALDVFKEIKNDVKHILDYTSDGLARTNAATELYPLAKMTREQQMESLEAYIKDIVLQKNDINSWTTKMETELPGAKQGMKHSLEFVRSIANKVFGPLSGDTAAAINDAQFVDMCDYNNRLMRGTFLRIENKLLKKYTTQYNVFYDLVDRLAGNDKSVYDLLVRILKEKRFVLSPEDFQNCMNLLNTFKNNGHKAPGYKIDSAKKFVNECLDMHKSNREIAQISGKNVTDFFISAAQETRARNKWMKLVYGLLGGTLALSALTIALMGKENHFNKYKYEYINTPEGADK